MKSAHALACLSLLALASCGGGAGDGLRDDFVEACVATTSLERAICECTADKAQEELSPKGFAFLVAGLQDDSEATARLRGELEISEAMATGMFMVNGPAQCAKELGGS